VAVTYGSVAVVWILVTGWLAAALPGPLSHEVEYLKGLFFVLVTSVALYFIILSWSSRTIAEADRAIEARRRLASVLETVPVGVLLLDAEGRIGLLNPTAADMLGITAEQAEGSYFADFCRPDGPAEEFDLDALLANGAASGLELGGSGERTPRAVVVRSAPADSGDPSAGWVVALADVTQEHLEHDRFRRLMNGYRFVAEASALANRAHDQEQLLREVCDLAVRYGGYIGALAVSLDPTGGPGRIIAMAKLGQETQAVARRLVEMRSPVPEGFSLSAVLGEKEISIRNNLAQDLANPWSVASSEGLAASATFASIRSSGEVVSVTLFSDIPGYFDQDQLSMLTALRSAVGFALEKLSLDSRRLVAEDALELSERNYRALFESNPMPMWIYDRETLRFVAVNRRACAKYGYTPEQFSGMTLLDVRSAQEVTALQNHLTHRTATATDVGFWTHRDAEGREFPVHVLTQPIEWQGRESVVVMVEEVARVDG